MSSVLIIEDDPAIQNIFVQTFTHEGFTVSAAENAAVGLVAVETQTFDVIILDLMMPGQSGLDFLTIFRQTYPTSPTLVVIASNIDNPTIVDKVKALGIAGYFVKSDQEPIDVVNYVRSLISGTTGAAPTA